jgi:hypothetical protein
VTPLSSTHDETEKRGPLTSAHEGWRNASNSKSVPLRSPPSGAWIGIITFGEQEASQGGRDEISTSFPLVQVPFDDGLPDPVCSRCGLWWA